MATALALFIGAAFALGASHAATARAASADTQPPTPPASVTATSAARTIIGLSWAPATDDVGVAGYDVYEDGSAVVSTQAVSASVSGLTCGTSYTFSVDAYDAAGNRSAATSVSVSTTACPTSGDAQPPTAPAWVIATSTATTLIGLAWAGAADNVAVSGYDIDENGTPIAKTQATSASVSGLACGTSYVFSVDAYDAEGHQSLATAVTVSTTACPNSADSQPPSAPAWLMATSTDATTVGLSWAAATDNVGVVGYDLYENGDPLVSTKAVSASVSGLTCGTSYTFSVDAYDRAGNISHETALDVSTTACAGKTDTQPPAAPASLNVTSVDAASVGLAWPQASDNVGVAGYDLYENGTKGIKTQGLSTTFSGLLCGTSYTFAVDAYDAAGNSSPQASVTVSTADCASSPPPQTNSGVYWGAYIEGPQTYGYLYGGTWSTAPWCDPGTQCALARFTQNAGKAPSIEHWGQPAPWDGPFDAGSMNLAESRGDIPALDMSTGSTSLSAIASGAYDASITAFAQAAKQWGHPFFLVLDEEMNGHWEGYGPGQNGTPADFIAAWRHMHDVFTAVGATNVTWVWCPNVNVYADPTLTFDQYYPGDAYVDWTGLIGYNWGSTGDQWLSFSQIYGSSYADMMKLAPTKPVFIAELASTEDGGSKAAWITDALSVQLPQNFPMIKAFLWFNWRIYEKGQYWPWEIESSPASQQAFAAAIGSPYYAAGGGFGNLPLLSKVPIPA